MNQQLKELAREVLRLLVTAKFTELETRTHGVRLSAHEMRKAVADYGKRLILPPEDGYQMMDVVEVRNARPKRWSVAMPLWTLEEGRSDLTLEMTVIEQRDGFSYELDDLHVL